MLCLTIGQLIIIWYFCKLKSLHVYPAYVLASYVSTDWKLLNGKRLVFSTCNLCNSVFIEGTHTFKFICWSLMTLVLRRREMERILRDRSWPTEQRINLMKSGLFTYKFTVNSPWHLKNYTGFLSLLLILYAPFFCCDLVCALGMQIISLTLHQSKI